MARRRNAACGVPCVVKGFVLNMKVEKDHTRRRPTCEGGGKRELVDQAFFVFLLPRFYVRVVAQVDLYGGHREETEASRAEGLGGERVSGLAVCRDGGEGGGGDMGQRGAGGSQEMYLGKFNTIA